MGDHQPFSSDGFDASWTSIGDGRSEQVALRWDNEAWTATVHVERGRFDYVVRLSPMWQVRQFLLFRDLDEPDLWLGTNGHGRWGEINGAHRPELDGAFDVTIAGSPFVDAIPIRRQQLTVGTRFESMVLEVDPDTLGVTRRTRAYHRLDDRRWLVDDEHSQVEFEVDQFGLPGDVGDFVRQW
jgi:uncharacterized protein